MNRKRLFVGVVVATVACCTTTIAIGAGPSLPLIHDAKSGKSEPQTVEPTSVEINDAFPVLSDASRRADVDAQQEMRDQMGTTAPVPGEPAGAADFSRATSSVIQGSMARASIVPLGNRVCLLLPDPVNGYGGTCASLKDIAAGRGFVALVSPGGRMAIIGALVPRGAVPPSIHSAGGVETALPVDGNVAASVVPIDSGDSLQVGAERVPLASLATSTRTSSTP